MNDDEQTSKDWGNYWQGRAAAQVGAALTGVGIENDADIENIWKEAFRDLPKQTKILDVACGAGSVLRHATHMGFDNLTGVDISSSALEALGQTLPHIKTVKSGVSKMPFTDDEFDIVTSQFGMEYAGIKDAVGEVLRVVSPQGFFMGICHKQGGAIAKEVLGKRDDAQIILNSEFIVKAKRVFDIDMGGGSDADFTHAAKEFSQAQKDVLALARDKKGLAAHLYSGTQALYQRRKAYALEDIHTWLDGMDHEIRAFWGRMESMLAAALTPADIEVIRDIAQGRNYQLSDVQNLYLGPNKEDAGWILKITPQDRSS